MTRDVVKGCELCEGEGGEVVVRIEQLRVVLVNDVRYPGFCRVIWSAHVKEMTDLTQLWYSTTLWLWAFRLPLGSLS